APSAEGVGGERGGVGSEEWAPLGVAALVGGEGGQHPVVERVGGRELDAPVDREREQDRASRALADGDQIGQLARGEHVQQRRGGDERGIGQVGPIQRHDVRAPCLDGDRGAVGGRTRRLGGGDLQQVGVTV